MPKDSGGFHDLDGYMTLCDGGYHNWDETMSGMNQPTNPEQSRWSGRYFSMYIICYIYTYITSFMSFADSLGAFTRDFTQHSLVFLHFVALMSPLRHKPLILLTQQSALVFLFRDSK